MEKSTKNLVIMNCFFVAALLIANVVASKVVSLWGLVVPAAVVAYPWTFLCTDVIGQIWGKAEANRTVRIGFTVQLFALGLIACAMALPVAPFATEFQAVFVSVLGSSWRFVLASLVAYLFSQSWDVWVFHKIKDAIAARNGGNSSAGRWIWNNASTMTSQVIDTAIFITIAFYGVVPNLALMILSQYVVKLFIAAFDTPVFYILTRKRG